MNKIFKTKFNTATHCWAAVSELASNKGKTGSVVNQSVSAKSSLNKLFFFPITTLSIAIFTGLVAPQALGIVAISSIDNYGYATNNNGALAGRVK